jgi:hypothetical protein
MKAFVAYGMAGQIASFSSSGATMPTTTARTLPSASRNWLPIRWPNRSALDSVSTTSTTC